jgi:hypothetical protein
MNFLNSDYWRKSNLGKILINYHAFVYLVLLTYLLFIFFSYNFLFSNSILMDVTVAGHYQLSDSSGHVNCMIQYKDFFFSKVNLTPDQWCLRRPTYPIIMSIFAIFDSHIVQLVILFNALLSSFSFLYLTNIFTSHVKTSKLFIGTYFILFSLISLRLIFSAGPESLALSISTLALAFTLRGIYGGDSKSIIFASGLTLLAYEIRPGNPIFVILMFLFTITTLRNYFKTFFSLGLTFLFIYVMPRSILVIMDIPNGYHSGNFWGTIYGLVSPKAYGYVDAYSDFAQLNNNLGEINLWSLAKSASLDLFVANPKVAIDQFLINILSFANKGSIELSLGLTRFIGFEFNYFYIYPIVIILNCLTIAVFIYVYIRDFITKKIFIPVFEYIRSPLLVYLVTYLSLSSLQGNSYLFTPFKTGTGALGFPILGFGFLQLISVIFLLSNLFLSRDKNDKKLSLLVISNWLGAAIFFGLVGHDEVMRHQTQSIPLYIMMLYVLFKRNNKSNLFESEQKIYFKNISYIYLVSVVLFTILFFHILSLNKNNRLLSISGCSNSSMFNFKIIDSTLNPYLKKENFQPRSLPPYNWTPDVLSNMRWKYLYKIYIVPNTSNTEFDSISYQTINFVSNLDLGSDFGKNSICFTQVGEDRANEIGHYYKIVKTI